MANQADQIQQTISVVIRAEIAELRTFFDRRIAELSAELHATTELMDFSESNLSGQLGSIREQIASVISKPAAATYNSGLELEAVVQATEAAAHTIMEATEAIMERIADARRDPSQLDGIERHVGVIFEACTFQDVTGQRIRRAIRHLQQVETILTDIAPPAPPPGTASGAPVRTAGDAAGDAAAGPDLRQDMVDALFA